MAHVQTEMEKKELAMKLEITIDVAPSITDVIKQLRPNPERQEEIQETMCRIPCELINANDGGVPDYKPRYISIGPYHWRANSMQDVKLQYLQDLLERDPEKNTVEAYMEAIREVCPSEQRKYHKFDTCGISSDDQFCKMLVLDGCFLVELLLKKHHASCVAFPGLDVHKLNRDLMLIENQISFSVLERIYERTNLKEKKVSLFNLAVSYLHSGENDVDPYKEEENVDRYKKVENVDHLLHLLYICRTNRLELNNSKSKMEIWKVILIILVIYVGIVGIFVISVHILSTSQVSERVVDGLMKGFYILFAVTGLLSLLFSASLAYYFLRVMMPFISYILVGVMYIVIFLVETWANEKTEHIRKGYGIDFPVIPTVKEIRYAGIKWAKISKNTAYKMWLVKWPPMFLTIEYKMHTGSMEISENSFSEFENLLFYEQIYFLPINPVTEDNSKDDNILNISTYAVYMRNLVETEMDIHFLKKQGVLTSTTSFIEDKEVTRFFRKQRPWMEFNNDHQEKIHEQFKLLKKFCYTGHGNRKSKLREEYFISPLVIFTFLGFLTILVLTALQTVYTMLGHDKDDKPKAQ